MIKRYYFDSSRDEYCMILNNGVFLTSAENFLLLRKFLERFYYYDIEIINYCKSVSCSVAKKYLNNLVKGF